MYQQETEEFLTGGGERLGALLHVARSKVVEKNKSLVYNHETFANAKYEIIY